MGRVQITRHLPHKAVRSSISAGTLPESVVKYSLNDDETCRYQNRNRLCQVHPNQDTISGNRSITQNRGKKMSSYENVVCGKLKLKGKALDVKAGGVKKKKKHKKEREQIDQVIEHDLSAGGSTEVSTTEPSETEKNDGDKQIVEEKAAPYDDHLTPAERRYIDQRQKLDVNRLAKESNKSHRDRIQDFNQYLANMSEHYDIPKVGPG
ncbi:hypothetical protein LWI28_016455 [Acer negundo]|uniref:Protein FAM32A-like n=1 Tax=Acer negundo TaxID=4023 RepID=A0AAD5NJ07_ACENE|nr:hypothetical protein LWI28_016455 [Acer negundo]